MHNILEKKRVVNPFAVNPKELYRCFGCSPYNENGLRLEFYMEGDTICTDWMPSKDFAGYVGMLHGGIQATLMDEIASWYVYAQLGTSGVTKSMQIEYLNPTRINGTSVHLRASMIEQNGNEAVLHTELHHNNKLCATGRIIYFVFPESIARAKYNYPGKEAFFETNEL